jgi:hypothetical protein
MMVEAKINYGFFYAQHLELELFNAHVTGLEVNLQQVTYGKHNWEIAFGYPIMGISFWYSNLANSPYLGSAYALFPYLNFPLYRHKDFMFNFRFGLGLGYLTKKFDRLTDYKNLAIGSHFNAAVSLMFEIRYKLSGRFTLSGGINFQHFSNGSLKLPNYGLNIPLVNLGVAYRLARENKNLVEHVYPPIEPFEAILKHTIDFDIGAFIGFKNMQAIYGENYTVWHFYENTFFPVSKKSLVGGGIDLSYDASHIKILEQSGDTVTNKLSILRPGINAAYGLMMGKLCFIFNLGYYLGGKEKSNGPFYEKFAVKYNITKEFFASVMLKVHYGRADYIGWGIGYTFVKLYGKKAIK